MHCPIFVIIIHHHRVTTQVDKNIDIKIQEREVRSISSSLSSVAFMRENEGNNHMDICHHFPCCCFAVYTISHFLFLIFPFIIGIIVNFQSCFHVSFLFIISCFWCFFLFCCFSLIGLYSKARILSFLSILSSIQSLIVEKIWYHFSNRYSSLSFYPSHVVSLTMTMMARVNYL